VVDKRSGVSDSYVPGWDCHGLPIENKALKDLNVRVFLLLNFCILSIRDCRLIRAASAAAQYAPNLTHDHPAISRGFSFSFFASLPLEYFT
jgi:hypothetical protein